MTVDLRRIDRRRLAIGAGEILCVVCVKNENLRLPHFLEYHRSLGVDRFFAIDNDSQDGTTEYLLSQQDVHVFTTEQEYLQNRCGVNWINAILEEYAVGYWTLSLDADELLVYPLCEQVDLRRLVKHFDRRGEEALLTFLLDMYSDRRIRDTTYRQGDSFLDTCRFFDGSSYTWDASNSVYAPVPVRGGPRARLFWEAYDRDRPPPFLPKIPLVKWRADLKYTASTHLLEGTVLAQQMSGVLLHFKLFSDLMERAVLPAKLDGNDNNIWQWQCAVYREVILDQPDLNPIYEGSVRYRDSRQLRSLGLTKTSHDLAQAFE